MHVWRRFASWRKQKQTSDNIIVYRGVAKGWTGGVPKIDAVGLYEHTRTVGCYIKAISTPVCSKCAKTRLFKLKISFFSGEGLPHPGKGTSRRKTYLFNKSYPRTYNISSSRTAFANLCPDRFFWATQFLANVNVLRYVCYMRSQFRLSSVCRLSVCLWRWCTLLRRLNFSAIFSPYDSPRTLVFWCQNSLVGDAPFP